MAVTLKGNNGTYEGTSEDNKPLDVPVNTEFNELDTGKTYYFDGETWNEEPPCEGGGFTPTAEQLAAMNSGITAEDVAQILTNENNILLKANTTDVNTATANLQAQIDQLITPTTQDAEVQNARVGADGTSYQTLKARLDTEYDALSNRIGEVISGGNNIDLTEYTDNIITATLLTGNTLAGSPSNRTIWIECDSNTKYIIDRGILNKYFGIATSEDAPVLNSTTINVIATDENKSVNHFEFTTPSNAKYLYIQFYHISVDTNYTLEQILASISVKSVVTLEDVATLQTTINAIMPYKGTLEANNITDINDCNNCGTYEVTNYTGVQNMPIASTGLVIVFSNEATKRRMVQMFQSNNGTLYKRYLWTSNSGIVTWEAWGKIISETDIYDITPDFSLFENFGVIGDSYASGEIYIADASSQSGYKAADYYNLSWGQIISRNCGSECTNFSKGGLTTQTWLTDSKGLALLQSESAKQIILCCLGLNDASTNGTSYIGNVSDIANENDTFFGNYGKIINSIKNKNSGTRIIMFTIPHVSWISDAIVESFNDAIKAIAQYFSIPLVDTADDYYYLSNSFILNMVGNHPTAINYSGMAKANKRLIENAMLENPIYFKEYIGL